jgi:hemolysin activation/secretion protein
LEANYPLLRSRLQNLYLALTLDQKSFDNRSAGITTTRYKNQVASLGLNGNLFDNLGGGGANTANISFVQGRVDLTGSPNEAADAATLQTAGSFNKLRFGVSRQQVLTDSVSLFAAFSGQTASKNLDSSEKFYLGGSSGVRAYPSSEGGGSEGQLLNLEVRKRLPGNLNLTGFYDWGSVLVNKNNNIVGATALNSYDLKGVGVSLAWISNFGLSVKATLSHRIGDNPNPAPNGNDQDGSLNVNRFWLQVSLPF